MSFKYNIFNSMPKTEILNDILKLHEDIFGASDDLLNKMMNKPQLLVITAMNDKVKLQSVGVFLIPH